MMAVVFNRANVRLGEVQLGEDCRILVFGGGVFARTDDEAMLESGAWGTAFDQTDSHHRVSLDRFNPTTIFPDQRRKGRLQIDGSCCQRCGGRMSLDNLSDCSPARCRRWPQP